MKMMLSTHPVGWAHEENPMIERSAVMADRYRGGETMNEIGAAFGITRERVRQILRRMGISAAEGGAAVIAKMRAAGKASMKAAEDEQRCRERYGIGYQDFLAIPDAARCAYVRQRSNAAARFIGWEFNLSTWWAVWNASGRWDERGLYVMARHGDQGPYSPENVRICNRAENSREARAHDRRTTAAQERRERIQKLKALGLSNAQIAERLGIATVTVWKACK